MTDFSRREAAARAGIDQETLDQLVDLEIVRPDDGDRFREGAVRKLALVGSLLAGGIPAAALAAKIRAGDFDMSFLDSPSFDTFTALSGRTFEEVASERAIPIEVLLAIRESVGAAVARPSDYVSEVELEIVPDGGHLFNEPGILDGLVRATDKFAG